MKMLKVEEEGVATAVGAILSILIVVLLLSVFVTSYIPAEMAVYEEHYTNGLMNSVMELDSYISVLRINSREGETVTVPFMLESGNVPYFSSPTVGTIAVSGGSQGSEGFLEVSNSTINILSGGYVSVNSNNRYYVDQSYYYVYSGVIGSEPVQGVNHPYVIESGLISIENATNSSFDIYVNLVRFVGGEVNVSTPGPVLLSLEEISSSAYRLTGNLTIKINSPFGSLLYSTLQEEFSQYRGIFVSYSQSGTEIAITISSPGENISTSVSELNLAISLSG
ncbi:MAG: hypothetical protein QXN66_03960 [Thermoplasmatales archaeon]